MIIYPIVYYLTIFDNKNATIYYEGAGKQVKRSHNAIPFPNFRTTKIFGCLY